MMRRMVPLATLTLLLLSGVATAACGKDSGGDKPKAAASKSAKVPSADELKKVLLVVSDMPAGYAENPEKSTSGAGPAASGSATASGQPGGGSSPGAARSGKASDGPSMGATKVECRRLFDSFDSKDADATQAGYATAGFEKPRGPHVTERLESYRDAELLKKTLAELRDAVRNCGEFTMKDEEAEGTIKIANASFPKFGDETAAFSLNAVLHSGTKQATVGGYLVAVRVGNTTCTLTVSSLQEVPTQEVEQIVRKAVDKVTPVAR